MENPHSRANGERVQSNGVAGSGEIELQTAVGTEELSNIDEDGDGEQTAEVEQNEHAKSDGTATYSRTQAILGQGGSRIMSKRETRKQKRLESWAVAETDPYTGKGCKCCLWNGSLDSVGCPLASPYDVYDILIHSGRVLGAYGIDVDELEKLVREHEPAFSKRMVVRFEHPIPGVDNCPPFYLCVDEERREVALYMRGLNLLHRADYVALMSNRKNEQPFKGGYIHYGMDKAAKWCVQHIGPELKEQLLKHEGFKLTLIGHSLGAGVCSILAVLLLEDTDVVGGIDPDLLRAYAIAPPRVLSLDLATKYAPHIYSVIYQDDFLPRVSTSSVKRAFMAAFAVTGLLLFLFWLKQHLKRRLLSDDIYRLYPPGRIFHVVYRQPGVHHDMPIQVRVVDSSQGRFERIILTSSGTAEDHSVLKLAKHLKTYDWPPDLRNKI